MLYFNQFRPNFVASLLFFYIFISIDNNLSSLLYFRLPSFYNYLCTFLGQNAHNTILFTYFSQFLLILTNFRPNLWRPYFFYIFISIDNNVSYFPYLRLHLFYLFYNFVCIFWSKCPYYKIFTKFSQFC